MCACSRRSVILLEFCTISTNKFGLEFLKRWYTVVQEVVYWELFRILFFKWNSLSLLNTVNFLHCNYRLLLNTFMNYKNLLCIRNTIASEAIYRFVPPLLFHCLICRIFLWSLTCGKMRNVIFFPHFVPSLLYKMGENQNFTFLANNLQE